MDEQIKDFARKYADVCEFKSDFPHDWNSVYDGFVEGFKTAERLLSLDQPQEEITGKLYQEYCDEIIQKAARYANENGGGMWGLAYKSYRKGAEWMQEHADQNKEE
jgi:hypothetical protein